MKKIGLHLSSFLLVGSAILLLAPNVSFGNVYGSDISGVKNLGTINSTPSPGSLIAFPKELSIPTSTYLYLGLYVGGKGNCSDSGTIVWTSENATNTFSSTQGVPIVNQWVAVPLGNLGATSTGNYWQAFQCGDASRHMTIGYTYQSGTSTNFSYAGSDAGYQVSYIISDSKTEALHASSSEISLAFPDGVTTTPDFANWVVYPGILDIGTYTIGVTYWQGSNFSYNYSDVRTFVESVTSTENLPLRIPKHQSLFFPPLLAPVLWHAYPEFYDSSGNLIYSGETTDFYISPVVHIPELTQLTSLASPWGYNTGDDTFGSSSTLLNFDCSAFDDASSTSPGILCRMGKLTTKVFEWLLKPTEGVLNYFTAQIDTITHFFPFNVVFDFTDTVIASAEAGPDDSEDYVLDLSYKANGTIHTITFLTSSTLQNAVGSSTKDLIFTVGESAIWLTTGVIMLLMIL